MGLCDIICIIMGLSMRFFCYCKYMRVLSYNWPAVSGFWLIGPGKVAGENLFEYTNTTR